LTIRSYVTRSACGHGDGGDGDSGGDGGRGDDGIMILVMVMTAARFTMRSYVTRSARYKSVTEVS
jgi:hypothetical protein